jgi:hypothetical protein
VLVIPPNGHQHIATTQVYEAEEHFISLMYLLTCMPTLSKLFRCMYIQRNKVDIPDDGRIRTKHVLIEKLDKIISSIYDANICILVNIRHRLNHFFVKISRHLVRLPKPETKRIMIRDRYIQTR